VPGAAEGLSSGLRRGGAGQGSCPVSPLRQRPRPGAVQGVTAYQVDYAMAALTVRAPASPLQPPGGSPFNLPMASLEGRAGAAARRPTPSTLHCPFPRACMAAPRVAPLQRLTKTPACDVCCPMMSGWLRARGRAVARCHRAPSGRRSRQHLDPSQALPERHRRARAPGVSGKLWATFLPSELPAAGRPPRGASVVARDFQTVAVYASDGSFVGVRRPGSGKPIEVRAPWRRCWRLAGVPVVVRSPCARMLSCDPADRY